MLLSSGVLVKSTTFTPLSWNGIPQPGITTAVRDLDLVNNWGSYAQLYRSQLWVAVLVNKLARAEARLPLKVYRRGEKGRPEAGDHPYAQLLRRPHPQIDPFSFWRWVSSIEDIYGEAFLRKVRDRAGRPVALVPLHPTRVKVKDDQWSYQPGDSTEEQPIPRRDLVHFAHFDPEFERGLSPLEPLRATLENEWGARVANSAVWSNGARPSVILKTPRALTPAAALRLKEQWNAAHGGVNSGGTAVLEEGMEAQFLSAQTATDLQYVESRRLNREEACAAFDVPPPVVHILDRATFSNITEQMRSMYRDTMAPRLKHHEQVLELQLRDGRMGERGDPDFGDEVYAEFLMDEVLRGAFETRMDAYQAAVNTGIMTPAEVRELENLPFAEGSDQLFINSAVVPIGMADDVTPGAAPSAAGDGTNDPVIARHLAGIAARRKQLEEGTDA